MSARRSHAGRARRRRRSRTRSAPTTGTRGWRRAHTAVVRGVRRGLAAAVDVARERHLRRVVARSAGRRQRVRRRVRALSGGDARRRRRPGPEPRRSCRASRTRSGPSMPRDRARVAGVPIVLVDGRDLFWWGIRTPGRGPDRRRAARSDGLLTRTFAAGSRHYQVSAPGARYVVGEIAEQSRPGTDRRLDPHLHGRPGRDRRHSLAAARRPDRDTPLWLLIALLVACSVVNAVVQSLEHRLSPEGRPAAPHGDGRDQHRVGRVRDGLGFDPRDRVRHRHRRPDARARLARLAARLALERDRDLRRRVRGRARYRADGPCGRRRPTRSRARRSSVSRSIARTLGASTAAAEKATAQVERDRSYFRDLVQHAADVIALVSPQFQIDYISPGIEPLVGRRRARASGSTIRDVLGPTRPTTSPAPTTR